MPITKSAKKSLKVSRTKAVVKKTQRVALSKALKKVDAETVNQTVSLIDKAAKTGLIHKNKAARMKSSLAKKMSSPETKVESRKSKVQSRKTVKSKSSVAKAIKAKAIKAKKK